MNIVELKNILNTKRKGQIIRIEYDSAPTMSAVGKAAGVTITKRTEISVRWGCSYRNIKSVKERIARDGEPETPKALWWHWDEGNRNVIKSHNTTGQQYLTVNVMKNAKPKVQYLFNGKIIQKEDLQATGYVIASYWNKPSEHLDVFDIKIENIINIK